MGFSQENKKPSQKEMERAKTNDYFLYFSSYTDVFLTTTIFFLIIALITSMEINTTMPKPNITSISVFEGLMIPKESRIDGI